MLSMASGKLPNNMAVDSITVTKLQNAHIFNHSLGKIPDVVFVIPKNAPNGTGSAKPYALVGLTLSGGGYGNCPNKLVTNQSNSSGAWDYSGNNQGWSADSQSISFEFNNSNRFPVGDYILVTYAYE